MAPRGLVGAGLTTTLAALVVLLPATSATADDASWSVRPQDATASVLEHTVRAGDEVDDAVVVRNDGTAALELAVSTSDTRADADGALEVADTRTGPGAWVTVDGADEPVALAAGEQVVVPVHVRVPADATPGTHVAAVVTTAADEQDGLAVERRLALRLILTVDEDAAGPRGVVTASAALLAAAVTLVFVVRARRSAVGSRGPHISP
ncbi:hypothetical protein [Cellulomonas persica]|uniref:hypothetical protein n=1 Tax=Cellulomonas persica TaxID=76861 RepID=UPI0011BE8A65|nr:hypothetical protein [Cellulomonas persica]